jgi:hypothetical protein
MNHPHPNQIRHAELVSASIHRFARIKRRRSAVQGSLKRVAAVSLACLGLVTTDQANAADQMCKQLEAFVKSQEAETADPMPRHWVEFHWGIDPDPISIWSWGCRHSDDPNSGRFCNWLMNNTSREFKNHLPLRIQQCMGYHFPREAWTNWDVSDATIAHQRSNGSKLVVEIVSKGLQPNESAVRVFYDSVAHSFDPDELPAVQPLHPGQESRLP